MAVPPLPLTKIRESQYAAVCSLGVGGLARVADELDALGAVINPTRIREVIAQITDEDTARIVQHFLISVATTTRRGFVTIPDILDGIHRSLVNAAHEMPSPQMWNDCRSGVERLLSCKAVVLSAKAADLASDFERFCIASRILTDIRPVFDDGREEIIGAAVTHTLRVDYLSPEGRRGNLSVALDMNDIEQLRKSCERAVLKTGAAKALMEQERRRETMLPGEERK